MQSDGPEAKAGRMMEPGQNKARASTGAAFASVIDPLSAAVEIPYQHDRDLFLRFERLADISKRRGKRHLGVLHTVSQTESGDGLLTSGKMRRNASRKNPGRLGHTKLQKCKNK